MGKSGSGKSTLLSLLLGELQPERGDILVNGRPLSVGLTAIPVASTLMPHDNLFHANVTDNISCLDPHPDRDRLLEVARLACVEEDILRLPLAFREMLSENRRQISAGQRQRLLIARALYRNRGLLLLDEATSHLDDDLAMKVMQRVLSQPGICIFVTHHARLAALADKVIMLGHSSRAGSLQAISH